MVYSHDSGISEGRGGSRGKGWGAVAVSAMQQRGERGRSQRDLNVIWQGGWSTRVADGYLARDGRAVL